MIEPKPLIELTGDLVEQSAAFHGSFFVLDDGVKCF